MRIRYTHATTQLLAFDAIGSCQRNNFQMVIYQACDGATEKIPIRQIVSEINIYNWSA